jgi:hypothetical protein
MRLANCRNSGLNSYTWFWVDEKGNVVSPYFASQNEANVWRKKKIKS